MSELAISYDAPLFIGGEFTEASSRKTLEIINPATGVTIGHLADANATGYLNRIRTPFAPPRARAPASEAAVLQGIRNKAGRRAPAC